MSEDIESNDSEEEIVTGELDRTPNELDILKAEANELGVTFHPKIGVAKLKIKITEYIKASEVPVKPKAPTIKPVIPQSIDHDEYKRLSLKERKKRAGSLIRINVVSMNPDKKGWEGEIMSVGSAKLGTYKKYVLFNTSDGWHVPYIIYEAMKDRKCSVFITVKDHLGKKIRKGKLINEFNIEVLPPLTKVELKELAQRQAMAGTLTEE